MGNRKKFIELLETLTKKKLTEWHLRIFKNKGGHANISELATKLVDFYFPDYKKLLNDLDENVLRDYLKKKKLGEKETKAEMIDSILSFLNPEKVALCTQLIS